MSHWSDSEDEGDEDYEDDIYDDYSNAYDGCEDEHWDTRSIVTAEIELETAEEMFVTLMASMADLLNTCPQRPPTATRDPPSQHRRHAVYEEVDEPPQTADPTPAISNSPSLQHLHPQPQSPTPSLTPTPHFAPTFHPFDADFAFDTDDDAELPAPPPPRLPHSVSMPLPTTEPPPWHQPRGHTPEPPHVSRRPTDAASFSIALARMGDWEARNATAVAREVYRRHAAATEPYAQSWCAGDGSARARTGSDSWEADGTLGSRRHGMIGDARLRLGVAFVEGKGGEPAVTVGRGIAYHAEERRKGSKLFGFLRRRKDSA